MSPFRTLALSKTGSMALAALAVMTLGADAQGLDYDYNIGSNYVMQSGSSCRAERRSIEESRMKHYPGYVTTSYGTSPTRVYCPIQRRSLGYYGVGTGSDDNEAGLNLSLTQVRVSKSDSWQPLSCTAFRKDLTTGALQVSTTKFLCSTSGGCTSNPASYSGANMLSLLSPVNNSLTMNYGFYCDLKGTSAQVHYSVSVVTPNPE